MLSSSVVRPPVVTNVGRVARNLIWEKSLNLTWWIYGTRIKNKCIGWPKEGLMHSEHSVSSRTTILLTSIFPTRRFCIHAKVEQLRTRYVVYKESDRVDVKWEPLTRNNKEKCLRLTMEFKCWNSLPLVTSIGGSLIMWYKSYWMEKDDKRNFCRCDKSAFAQPVLPRIR